MNNSGCHGNQSKKPLKIFSSQTANWIAFFFLQECSLDRGLQNSLKKKRSVKKHGFYGRLIFLLWYKVKSLKNFFSKTIYWISLFFAGKFLWWLSTKLFLWWLYTKFLFKKMIHLKTHFLIDKAYFSMYGT